MAAQVKSREEKVYNISNKVQHLWTEGDFLITFNPTVYAKLRKVM